ncbi:MAG: hypothetical protein ACOC9P_00280 [bacterium]
MLDVEDDHIVAVRAEQAKGGEGSVQLIDHVADAAVDYLQRGRPEPSWMTQVLLST